MQKSNAVVLLSRKKKYKALLTQAKYSDLGCMHWEPDSASGHDDIELSALW